MKFFRKFLLGLIGLYVVLLVPDCSNEIPVLPEGSKAFTWNRDAHWKKLEQQFEWAKQISDDSLHQEIESRKLSLEEIFSFVQQHDIAPGDTVFSKLTEGFFALAPFMAVAPSEQLHWYSNFYHLVREEVKSQSVQWNFKNPAVRNAVYSLLYGMRAAYEEVLLQTGKPANHSPLQADTVPASTPFINILGIKVHSGDLLVSRGAAAVSAFISRANDYPGNFSHVAVLHIDEKTNVASVVEAHIEKGVAIASGEQYLQDKKMRFMVMRPNLHLPQLQKDPLLPHKAATAILQAARHRHIPYDFHMNHTDTSAMFCSEVAAVAYKSMGLQLWKSESTISSAGVANWLSAFGVTNFTTQMPSDLEYDPQLQVAAEWRDADGLLKDHIDNAVMDVLFEQANKGKALQYNYWLLPVARVLKAYSFFQNRIGNEAVIPEGMSATQALKNQYFESLHKRMVQRLSNEVETFVTTKHHLPPYWRLVEMATGIYNHL